MPMATNQINAKATQSFVPIKEVRDGVIVLKDGSLRAILLVTSINFELKSEDEQKSILYQFQNFLNSLDFSLQILVESRKLDIRPYLALLQDRYKEQTNDLMKVQVQEYIEFIRKFTESTNIMSKNFFVVVSYVPAAVNIGKGGFLRNIIGRKNTAAMENINFEEARSQLEERVSVVEQGLVRTGVKAGRLGTEMVVELFYKMFNPGETEKPAMPV